MKGEIIDESMLEDGLETPVVENRIYYSLEVCLKEQNRSRGHPNIIRAYRRNLSLSDAFEFARLVELGGLFYLPLISGEKAVVLSVEDLTKIRK